MWPLIALRRAWTPLTQQGAEEHANFSPKQWTAAALYLWFIHIIFSFCWNLKRYSPQSLPRLRLQEFPDDLLKALLATGPAAWKLTQIQLLGNHLIWFVLLPPPQSAPLHSRHPAILKVRHSPLHSEKSRNTPSCFPWRRKQRKCQVLYWWGIHSDCHWAGRSWVVGSGDATELENGPNHVLQSEEYSRAGTQRGAFCPHANTVCGVLVNRWKIWIVGSEMPHL